MRFRLNHSVWTHWKIAGISVESPFVRWLKVVFIIIWLEKPNSPILSHSFSLWLKSALSILSVGETSWSSTMLVMHYQASSCRPVEVLGVRLNPLLSMRLQRYRLDRSIGWTRRYLKVRIWLKSVKEARWLVCYRFVNAPKNEVQTGGTKYRARMLATRRAFRVTHRTLLSFFIYFAYRL